MRIIDLTATVDNGYPVYPGDPDIKIEYAANHTDDGFQTLKLSFGTHFGTHVDLPLHIIENSEDASVFPLEKMIGNAVVLSVPKDKNEKITVDDIKSADLNEDDILLLNTGWDKYNGKSEFFIDYPYLDEKTADYLVEKKISALGIDSPSVDCHSSNDPVHKKLLTARIPIVEGLINLDKLIGYKVTCIALPLKIAGADGSPVRAVALI
jgi:arylformamidase